MPIYSINLTTKTHSSAHPYPPIRTNAHTDARALTCRMCWKFYSKEEKWKRKTVSRNLYLEQLQLQRGVVGWQWEIPAVRLQCAPQSRLPTNACVRAAFCCALLVANIFGQVEVRCHINIYSKVVGCLFVLPSLLLDCHLTCNKVELSNVRQLLLICLSILLPLKFDPQNDVGLSILQL